jgi:hypothetical protein
MRNDNRSCDCCWNLITVGSLLVLVFLARNDVVGFLSGAAHALVWCAGIAAAVGVLVFFISLQSLLENQPRIAWTGLLMMLGGTFMMPVLIHLLA